MARYSREQRERAVGLYERYGHSAADCILMLLYIVKGFGVLGWLVRGGDGLDPEGGASFEFGKVAGAAFDLADAAGGDAEGVADLLLGDAVRDA